MTQEQLDEILSNPKIESQIKALSVSSYETPKWADLRKQYDPGEHAIIKDLSRYPVITNPETGSDDMKRITRGLQKLAAHRMSQAMFATPVERQYNFDDNLETESTAVDVIEEIYRTHNDIDAENIERAKMNNASCQVATVWKVKEKPSKIKGQESKYTLKHTSYSEIDGYKIYANYDNDKELLVISFNYKDSSDVEYFDIYTGGKSPMFISYINKGSWSLANIPENPKKLEFLPVVHTWLKEPVWGGDSGTVQVETIEETVSYRAMYIKKNAVPLATMDIGDTSGMTKGSEDESDKDQRRVVKVGKGGKIEYVVWDVNNGTSEQQIKDMTNAFFEDNQIPNISFANLLNSRTSEDNKEIMLTDSKGKAIDLGGEWEKLFNYELNEIVIPFAKIMFPSLSEAFDSISVRSKVKPYSTKTDKQNAELVANAGTSMSLDTKVRILNKVDDVASEVEKIQEENSANANLIL